MLKAGLDRVALATGGDGRVETDMERKREEKRAAIAQSEDRVCAWWSDAIQSVGAEGGNDFIGGRCSTMTRYCLDLCRFVCSVLPWKDGMPALSANSLSLLFSSGSKDRGTPDGLSLLPLSRWPWSARVRGKGSRSPRSRTDTLVRVLTLQPPSLSPFSCTA